MPLAGVLRETEKRRQLISAPTVPMQQPVQVHALSFIPPQCESSP